MDTRKLKNVGQLVFFLADTGGKEICMLSTGGDPHFELMLPDNVMNSLSDGGTVVIELYAFA
jgi:hypothetical protein